MKYTLELSPLEVRIIRAALATYAEAAKRKAEPTRGPKPAAATNAVQAAVAMSELDRRLAELERKSEAS